MFYIKSINTEEVQMIKQVGQKLVRRFDKELLWIEPWGDNSLRIRATQCATFVEESYSALLDQPQSAAVIQIDGEHATITNGKITCEVMVTGKLKFYNQKGVCILEEYDRNRMRENIVGEFNSALEIDARTFEPYPNTSSYKLTARFEASEGEKFYGMGQYQQPYLELKGCILELAQRNSQASVPFALSNKGYGMLWNNPAIGAVTFGTHVTDRTSVV